MLPALFGLTQTTITFNDFAPEMLACAGRGSFAEPDEVERVEYLLTRLRSERTRVDHENYALEHVLSYQRRVAMTKESFMRRGKKTPSSIFNYRCGSAPKRKCELRCMEEEGEFQAAPTAIEPQG